MGDVLKTVPVMFAIQNLYQYAQKGMEKNVQRELDEFPV